MINIALINPMITRGIPKNIVGMSRFIPVINATPIPTAAIMLASCPAPPRPANNPIPRNNPAMPSAIGSMLSDLNIVLLEPIVLGISHSTSEGGKNPT